MTSGTFIPNPPMGKCYNSRLVLFQKGNPTSLQGNIFPSGEVYNIPFHVGKRYAFWEHMHSVFKVNYEKVETFKYLGSLLTNQNSIQEEIERRLKAGNSCYYSFQTLLSSRLLSKNFLIKNR